MRYLVLLFLSLLLCGQTAQAGDRGAVASLLKEKVDAVFLLLQNKQLEKPQRHARLIEVVTPMFDFKTMAKLSLGKKYWPGLSRAQQETFSDLFIQRLQDSYLEKLDLYTDERVVYEEPREVDNKIHMATTLLSGAERISMLYKFYRADGGWKVYDIEIEGVSIMQTYRSQFDGVMKKGGIDELLEKLRRVGEFTIPSANR